MQANTNQSRSKLFESLRDDNRPLPTWPNQKLIGVKLGRPWLQGPSCTIPKMSQWVRQTGSKRRSVDAHTRGKYR